MTGESGNRLTQSANGTEYGEASSAVFDRWISKADENIAEWGLQDEETLLLAIQEELGELTQAHLEARAEGGDPGQVDKELDDLGALLLQFHEVRNSQSQDEEGDWCGNCGQEKSRHPVQKEDPGIACEQYLHAGTKRSGASR